MSNNQKLEWNSHQCTLVQVLNDLLSTQALVDCTLAAEGQYLHAHKVVLCACSPYLDMLLRLHYEKHPIVIMKDVKFQELKLMVDYMYKGKIDVSEGKLEDFLKAAESLQIRGLKYGGGDKNDIRICTRDSGSTSQKRNESVLIGESIPHNQSESPVILPRQVSDDLPEKQSDSSSTSTAGSISPMLRKRKRPRIFSQGGKKGHVDNSCNLSRRSQTSGVTASIPTTTKAPTPTPRKRGRPKKVLQNITEGHVDNLFYPPRRLRSLSMALPISTSTPTSPPRSLTTLMKAPSLNEYFKNSKSDILSDLPENVPKKEIEPQTKMMFIEPKVKCKDETEEHSTLCDDNNDETSEYDTCVHCKKTFTKINKLRWHLQNRHSVYKCEFCDFHAREREELAHHTSNEHENLSR